MPGNGSIVAAISGHHKSWGATVSSTRDFQSKSVIFGYSVKAREICVTTHTRGNREPLFGLRALGI